MLLCFIFNVLFNPQPFEQASCEYLCINEEIQVLRSCTTCQTRLNNQEIIVPLDGVLAVGERDCQLVNPVNKNMLTLQQTFKSHVSE